jgi:Heavy metal associated domain 2
MTKTISSRERLNNQVKISPESISNIRAQSDENRQSVKSEEAQETVQALDMELQEIGLQIVHATTERVRICATDSSSKELDQESSNSSIKELIDAICSILQQREGIKQITWNEPTKSLVIAFDSQLLPLPQVLTILEEFGVKRQKGSEESSENQFKQSSEKQFKQSSEKQKVDPFAAWKSAEFWQEQGLDLIPLFAGLAVTSRLAIGGLASIPVYMLTANITRRIIAYTQQALATETEKPKEIKKEAKKEIQKAKKSVSGSEKKSHSSPSQVTSDEVLGKDKTEKNNSPSKSLGSKVEKASTLERKVDHKLASEHQSNVVFKASGLTTRQAKINYSIVHSIPGRIRFNIPRIAKDRAYAKTLERLLKTEPHVTNVRINCDAASVAIAFQPSSLNASHWLGLLELADEVIPSTSQSNSTKLNRQLNTPENQRQVIESQTQLLQVDAIEKLTSGTVVTATEVNSIVADLKPPFINLLIDVVAKFPLE